MYLTFDKNLKSTFMITGAIIGAVVGMVVFLIQTNKKKKQEQTDLLDDSESIDSTNKEK